MVRRLQAERGDIVRVSLEPTAGHELQGQFRPVLVLSSAAFNALGLAIVAPISQGGNLARVAGFAVPLSGSGTQTQGAALLNQLRALDLQARHASRIERAPAVVMDDALARLAAIFS